MSEPTAIRSLTVRAVDLPLERPVETAAGPILREPLAVVAGEARVPQRPGAGIEWDEAALRRLLGR